MIMLADNGANAGLNALCRIEITVTMLGALVCKVFYCSDFLTILTQRIKQDKTTVCRPSVGFEKFKETTCSYCEPTTSLHTIHD